MESNFKEKLKDITTFVFDVDGVFTDSAILITTTGELLRQMSVRDGFAVKMALEKGYKICVISGGKNEGVRARLKGLGVTDIYLGAQHKEEPFIEYLDLYEISREEVLYMGDDLPDIPAMKLSGMITCPQDAVPEVKALAHYISHKAGGQGCVRDIIEQVLRVRGDWQDYQQADND